MLHLLKKSGMSNIYHPYMLLMGKSYFCSAENLRCVAEEKSNVEGSGRTSVTIRIRIIKASFQLV
jgi:hypothetical protein